MLAAMLANARAISGNSNASNAHVDGCVCDSCVRDGRSALSMLEDELEPVDNDKLATFHACHEAKCGAEGSAAMQAKARADTISAGEAAANDLGDGDAYGKQLMAWVSRIAQLPDGKRPPKPPAPPYQNQRGEDLRIRRANAHTTLLSQWKLLRERWLIMNDARKKHLRAERDAQRWKEGAPQRAIDHAKRRAARVRLTAAKQKPLWRVLPSEAEALLTSSRSMVESGGRCGQGNVVDAWKRLLDITSFSQSWNFGNDVDD